MEKEIKISWKNRVANFFGVIGYIACFLQWSWAVIQYISTIMSFSISAVDVEKNNQMTKPIIDLGTLPSSALTITSVIVIIFIITITIYAFSKTPSAIVSTGTKVVHKAAEATAPLIIKSSHKKDTKKFRLIITAKLVVVFKAALIIIPLIATVLSKFLDDQSFDYQIATLVALALTAISLLLFTLQYISAKVFGVETKMLR